MNQHINNDRISRWLQISLQHPLLIILILLVVSASAVPGLFRLQVDTSLNSLIPQYSSERRIYEEVADEFGTDNTTIVYVKDSSLWSVEKLQHLKKLHDKLQSLSAVTHVSSLINLQNIRGTKGEINSGKLFEDLPGTDEEVNQKREQALNNPLLIDNFLSSNGEVTALIVSVTEDKEALEFDEKLNEQLNAIVSESSQDFKHIFQVGSSRVNAEIKQSLFHDLTRLAPLSAVFLIVTLLLFLRNGLAAFVPILTSALSILWTFGLMGYTNIPLNILSAMLPSLVIVIGSTEDTHMITQWMTAFKRGENSRLDASRIMMSHMGLPILLTLLTTTLGFASNAFSSIGLIRDFAFSSSFAILSNGLITLMLVPLLLSRFGSASTIDQQGKKARLPTLMAKIFDGSNRHYAKRILFITASLCAFFIYQANNLRVTNDPLSYFKDDRLLLTQIRTLHQDLSGMKVFYITLKSDRDKAFQHPKNVKKLIDIQDFINKQGIFDRSLSLADYLSLVNREFYNGDPLSFAIPRTRELTAQYLLFFHRNELSRYVSHDFSQANIVVRHNISDSQTLNEHISELRQVVSKIAGSDIDTFVVGENLMVNEAAETLMLAQVNSLLILLVVIFLIMSLMFTSFKGGFISLIPAMIPIIMMFGVMGLLNIPLNPGTAMVAVIAIGIAIDGTIHLFSRYNALCRTTSDYNHAVIETVRNESSPVIITSIALSLGFGVLLFSDFSIIAQFGALSAATMLFSIFANLLITPLIMSRIRLVGLYEILSLNLQQDKLSESSLFIGMTPYQIRKAILISEHQQFKSGDYLIKQDSYDRSMFVIINGHVTVTRHDKNKDKELASLKHGDVFGEIGFVKETKRTADVVADDDVEVLRFDFEKLAKDLKFFPNIVAKLNYNISVILGERLAEIIEKHKMR